MNKMENNLNEFGQTLYENSRASMENFWNDGFDQSLRSYCFIGQQLNELEQEMTKNIGSKEHAVTARTFKDLSALFVKFGASLGLTPSGRLKFKSLLNTKTTKKEL